MGQFTHHNTKEKPLPERLRNAVVAIGNFDGVHQGHQKILQQALDKAKETQSPALALVFQPHPRQVLQPNCDMFLLTPPPLRTQLLNLLGFDAVLECPFTHAFAKLSAEDFVTHILEKRLGCHHVMVGSNFHFGKNREGTPTNLISLGKKHGFTANIVHLFEHESKKLVSSSHIRLLLEKGNVRTAANFLGYHYITRAKIVSGNKLGRQLGFPTANMHLPLENKLRYGVYAVHFRRENKQIFKGVASVGRRPTVEENGIPILETFLFDFCDTLYGEICEVSFFDFLRSEIKFDSLDDLVSQMKKDEHQARELLHNVTPLSPIDEQVAFPSSWTTNLTSKDSCVFVL